MAEIEKRVNPESDSMQLFEKSAEIGLRVAAPYKEIIKWLIIGFTSLLIITNLVWGGVFFYHVHRAYEPEEIEITQNQDIPNQVQEQTQKTKGVS